MIKAGIFACGEDIQSRGSGDFAIINPHSGDRIACVEDVTVDDLNGVIEHASSAFDSWNRIDVNVKEECFHRLISLLDGEEIRLAQLIMEESGSTLVKAKAEIVASLNMLRAAVGEIRRMGGATIPDDRKSRFSLTVQEPLGVLAAICPFNAPLALLVKMAMYPIAAGNVVIVKPSEETPLVALEFARLMTLAGFPGSVLSVICGQGSTLAQALISHPIIAGVTFTGSTVVGRSVAKQAGSDIKKVHLELGGNNPLIVCSDYDLEAAVDAVIFSGFYHAGQICMASSRILVDRGVYHKFRSCLVERVSDIYLGSLEHDKTLYGPLINHVAKSTVNRHIDDALSLGANVLCGYGYQEPLRMLPTILENVSYESKLWTEETFGPVVSLTPFDSVSMAIALANHSQFGLSAGVLTNDYRRGLQMASKLKCGAVHIGNHPFQSGSMTPVGGYKLSGLGRSGGHYSSEFFTQTKWISMTSDKLDWF